MRHPIDGKNPGPSNYTYTGQYSNVDDFGLMFYNARWYDSVIGRFTQPDTIIPEQSQGTQAWDRFAYVNNNPVVYFDITGHDAIGITTLTFTSATSFTMAAQGASEAINTVKGWESKLLIGGATLVGALGAVAGTTASGGQFELGVGLGVVAGGGAYALGTETLLDQFDNDLQNLDEMQEFVTAQFADGATEATMTITDKQMTIGTVVNGMVIPTSFTVQEITICTNLGVCSKTFTTLVPSDQHAMDRFEDFIPEDEDEQEVEILEEDDDI